MKNVNLIVHCTYDEKGKAVEQIINESFRVFLRKEIGVFLNGSGCRE